MSAQRQMQSEHLPGGYRSPNAANAVQPTVFHASAPENQLVPRSLVSTARMLGGVIVAFSITVGLQLAVAQSQAQLRALDRSLLETNNAIAQQQHILHSTLKARNQQAAAMFAAAPLPDSDAVETISIEPAPTPAWLARAN